MQIIVDRSCVAVRASACIVRKSITTVRAPQTGIGNCSLGHAFRGLHAFSGPPAPPKHIGTPRHPLVVVCDYTSALLRACQTPLVSCHSIMHQHLDTRGTHTHERHDTDHSHIHIHNAEHAFGFIMFHASLNAPVGAQMYMRRDL